MTRRKMVLTAVATLAIAGGTTIAVASHKFEHPQIVDVQGALSANFKGGSQGFCEGEDGHPFMEFKRTWTGNSDSTEASLTGNIKVTATGLVDQATGRGTMKGTITWLDPATGERTAKSTFDAVIRGLAARGHFYSGFTTSIANRTGITETLKPFLLGSFSLFFATPEFQSFNATFGQEGIPEDFAVVSYGSCPNFP